MHETQQAVRNDQDRKEKMISVDDVRGDSVRTPGGAPGQPGQPRQPRPRL